MIPFVAIFLPAVVYPQIPEECFITTIAGTGEAGFSGDGGPAVDARLLSPIGVAIDPGGNLFISDYVNHRIRKVDPQGTITTWAGTGEAGFSGDGGPALDANLWYPRDIAVDATGNLFIADSVNYRVRKVDPQGIITTVVGTGADGVSGDGGPAVQAGLASPWGLAFDSAGNLYIATQNIDLRLKVFPPPPSPPSVLETSHRIRKVDPQGTISTFAGMGEWDFSGDGGPATNANFFSPRGMVLDAGGNLYVADSENYRIRKIDPQGIITTAAGTGVWGFSGDGGPAVAAQISFPVGLDVDANGNLYFADFANHRIRRVDPQGIVVTVAGTGIRGFSGDGGPAFNARLNAPADVALDSNGNLYIADLGNNRIRMARCPSTTDTPPTPTFRQNIQTRINRFQNWIKRFLIYP